MLVICILFLTFASLFFLIIFIANLGYKNKVFANTYIGNVDVSGLSREELTSKLNSLVPNYTKTSIKIRIEKGVQDIPIESFGVTYDVNTIADNAYNQGRDKGLIVNQIYRTKSLFAKNQIEPIFSVNNLKFDDLLNSRFAAYEIAPVNASVVFKDGGFSVLNDKAGKLLDRSDFVLRLRDDLSSFSNSDIQAKIIDANADITVASVEKALTKVKSLDKRKITLSYEGLSWSLNGQDLIDLIRFYPKGYAADYLIGTNLAFPVYIKTAVLPDNNTNEIDLSLDDQKLESFINDISSQINRPTVDATLKFEGGKVSEFKAAQDGISLDTGATQRLILEKLSQNDNGNVGNIQISLPVNITHAKIANEEINSLGIKELVGKGISYYSHSIPNRIFNVGLGASRLSGTLVPPGGSFSFNNSVGEVSGASGYKPAYVISSGRTILDDGGGICQVSTTLFRAVLNAGLPVVTRTAHAYRVGYYEEGGYKPGFDATVWAPSVDFQFKNDTDHYLLVQSVCPPDTISATNGNFGGVSFSIHEAKT